MRRQHDVPCKRRTRHRELQKRRQAERLLGNDFHRVFMGNHRTSGAPLIFTTRVEQMLSGAVAGTSTMAPAGVAEVLSFVPLKRHAADSTSFRRPGTSNLPSAGQSNTWR